MASAVSAPVVMTVSRAYVVVNISTRRKREEREEREREERGERKREERKEREREGGGDEREESEREVISLIVLSVLLSLASRSCAL